MGRIVVLVAVFIITSSPVLAQKAVSNASNTTSIASLKISDPLFEGMCQSFAKQLGVSSEAEALIIRPKLTNLRPGEEVGNIWIVSFKQRTLKIRYHNLPSKLDTLRGPLARKVLSMMCFLEDEDFNSTRDVVITTGSVEDVHFLVNIFR